MIERMKELIAKLNDASRAYYSQDKEIMSNYEYDMLYDELVELESKTGVIMALSPTQHVGYEAVKSLPKEAHERPMLSLSKTKSREELREWMQEKLAILSWKLDGLTVVLTYNEGKLAKAVTRGDGITGEVITANAKTFRNIPLNIAFKGELVIRGEAVISYSDFEKINDEIDDISSKYKNPRNLCSGSVRQLDPAVTAGRCVRFFAFSLVKAEGFDAANSRKNELDFLNNQGFEAVEYRLSDSASLFSDIDYFSERIKTYDIPSDGLVLTYDDIAFGDNLGITAKYPKNAIAFKWADETAETVLREVEWSASRTGLINPVAVFDPVELEGTTVSRASVHNISIVRELKLGIGDRLLVYKANMIIPQIAENLTKSDSLVIPDNCPVCGGKADIRKINDTSALYCLSDSCPAKHINSLALMVSRDALNIEGFSKATLEKFIEHGFISRFSDIFHLDRYREEITCMEGFGEKSCANLIESIEKARNTTLFRVIYGLGIENVGLVVAKLICRAYSDEVRDIINASREDLTTIDQIGEVIADSFVTYFENTAQREEFLNLLSELKLEKITAGEQEQVLSGKSFVVTGTLNHFKSRDEFKAVVEQYGGKLTGSVTSKTEALVNNDVLSSSSKNKKAKELNVRIISEEDFLREYLPDYRPLL